jgi:opacity protein-like surface antigen
MKKMVLLLVLLCILEIQGRPQDIKTPQVTIDAKIVETSRFYVQGDLGIAFGTHAEIFNQTTTTTANESSSTTTDAIKARLGTGTPMGIAGGYMINKNFGVELGVEFFQGFDTKVVNSINGDETKKLISAPHLGIIPTFVAQFEACHMIPYVKLGIDIGVTNDLEIRLTTSTSQTLTRDYGGLALGVKAVSGVEFPLSKLISLFVEIDARQFSYSPMHGKVVKYTVNGQNELSTLSTRDSKWDYVKSINSSDPAPTDEPNKVLRETHSIDNVGVEFGVRFSLGK